MVKVIGNLQAKILMFTWLNLIGLKLGKRHLFIWKQISIPISAFSTLNFVKKSGRVMYKHFMHDKHFLSRSDISDIRYKRREVRWNSVWRETMASSVCHNILSDRCNCTYGLPLLHAKRCFISPPFLCTENELSHQHFHQQHSSKSKDVSVKTTVNDVLTTF